MNLIDLTYLLLEINAALDTGEYGDVTIKEIQYHLDQGDIIEFLDNRLFGSVNLSYFNENQEIGFEVNNHIYKVMINNLGKENEELGIQNNGLCLLIAYITEIIQQVLRDDYKD